MDIAFDRIKCLVERYNIKKEFDCLRVITLNISETCNQNCPPCPRSNGYQNSNQFMNLELIDILKNQLTELEYDGIISISGMGEPCLNKDLITICQLLKKFYIQVITNGTIDYDYEELSKYAKILVSIHNQNLINDYKKKFSNIPVIFRNHDINSSHCELKITNRGGWNNPTSTHNKKKTLCNYPFYKLLIDYDGSFLLCSEDWKRVSKIWNNNIRLMNINTYFTNYLTNFKNEMLKKGRLYEPCIYCNIDGRMIGSNIVEWYLKNVYKK